VGCGIHFTSEPEGKILRRLREDFCHDVLSQLCDEWRLRCGVVLRWSLAWYLQRGVTELPGALQEMPAFWQNGQSERGQGVQQVLDHSLGCSEAGLQRAGGRPGRHPSGCPLSPKEDSLVHEASWQGQLTNSQVVTAPAQRLGRLMSRCAATKISKMRDKGCCAWSGAPADRVGQALRGPLTSFSSKLTRRREVRWSSWGGDGGRWWARAKPVPRVRHRLRCEWRGPPISGSQRAFCERSVVLVALESGLSGSGASRSAGGAVCWKA